MDLFLGQFFFLVNTGVAISGAHQVVKDTLLSAVTFDSVNIWILFVFLIFVHKVEPCRTVPEYAFHEDVPNSVGSNS